MQDQAISDTVQAKQQDLQRAPQDPAIRHQIGPVPNLLTGAAGLARGDALIRAAMTLPGGGVVPFPRGVYRYATLEAAQAHREACRIAAMVARAKVLADE